MKTIYYLQDFHKAVKEIAALRDQNFTTVRVSIDSDGSFKFEAYVNTFGWHDAPTMERCLDSLRAAMGLLAKPNIDVLIESEN